MNEKLVTACLATVEHEARRCFTAHEVARLQALVAELLLRVSQVKRELAMVEVAL